MEFDISNNSQTATGRLLTRKKTRSKDNFIVRYFKRHKKRSIRYALLSANVLLLFAVVGFINSNPNASVPARQSAFVENRSDTISNPLDQLSSADIAVHISRAVYMDQMVSVANNADSVNAQMSIVPADDSVVSKPQVVATALKSKQDIQTYTTKEGDTLSSVASRFGVSSDSIRWSNDLSSTLLEVGTKLVIPPRGVNGIVYTVQDGDTPESLATKYRSTKDSIIAFNDAEVSGLVKGERIVIPDGQKPAPVVQNTYSYFSNSFSAVYGYNGYDMGWCTWWAAKRRADVGNPLPSNLGNAVTWAPRARAAGIGVSNRPAVGTVIWHNQSATGYVAGGLGHVGFVEKVNPDGSIIVSDMNSSGFVNIDLSGGRTGGWNRVSYRLVSPAEFYKYEFIY